MPSRLVHLTSSTTTNSPDGYNITVQISAQDLLRIRDMPGLATELSNTWFTIQAYAIDDVQGVDLLAIADGKALNAYAYIPDNDPPIFVSFDLDLNLGMLTIHMSDLLSTSSFNSSYLTIKSSTSSPFSSLPISGGKVSRLPHGFSVCLTFLDSVLDSLLMMRDLAVSENTTYLDIQAHFVTDLSDNSADAVMDANVGVYRNDFTSPRVISFTLSIKGNTVIGLDEIIDGQTFRPEYIIIEGIDNSTSSINKL